MKLGLWGFVQGLGSCESGVRGNFININTGIFREKCLLKLWVALKRAFCEVVSSSLLGLLGLLGEKHSLDVRQHTSLGDGDT
jgi:hypothetical protein